MDKHSNVISAILYIAVILTRENKSSVCATSVLAKMESKANINHLRVKRTPIPLPVFGPAGPFGPPMPPAGPPGPLVPLGPPIGPLPLPGPPTFGFEAGPGGPPPPLIGPEVFGRGPFRPPIRLPLISRPFSTLAAPRTRRRGERRGPPPVIIETADGTQNVFVQPGDIRLRGRRPGLAVAGGMPTILATQGRGSRPPVRPQRGGGTIVGSTDLSSPGEVPANPIGIPATPTRTPSISVGIPSTPVGIPSRSAGVSSIPTAVPSAPVIATTVTAIRNPLPVCSSDTVLRCRPWPAGANPSTAHMCYGDCPGRTCLVHCICTCETEQTPRVLLARVVGLGGRGGAAPRPVVDFDLAGGTVGVGDLSLTPDRNSPNTEIGNVDFNLLNPGLGAEISMEPPVMGIPIPVTETAASLPQLGVSGNNLGSVPEPEITFINAFDSSPGRNDGVIDGAGSALISPGGVVALEAPSVKTEIDLKVASPSLEINAGPSIEVSADVPKPNEIRDAGPAIRDIEIRPLFDTAASANILKLDEPKLFTQAGTDAAVLSGVDLSLPAVEPSIDFVNIATDPIFAGGSLNRGNSGAISSSMVFDEPVLGSDLSSVALTLPTPGPAPAPPLKITDNVAASSILPAAVEVEIKTKQSNVDEGTRNVQIKPDLSATELDKSFPLFSNSNQKDLLKDLNSLNALLMAMGGQGLTGDTVGGGIDKTAVLSEIAGSSKAPLARLDVLVKDLSKNGLFPGGFIDRNLSGINNATLNNSSSLLGPILNDSPGSLDVILAAMAAKDKDILSAAILGQSGDQGLMGLGSEGANLALLAAALGMTGGRNSPFIDLLGGSSLNKLGFGGNAVNNNNTNINGSASVQSPMLQPGDKVGPSGNLSAVIDVMQESINRLSGSKAKSSVSDSGMGMLLSSNESGQGVHQWDWKHVTNGTKPINVNEIKTASLDPSINSQVIDNSSVADPLPNGATTKECLAKGLEIWCDPVGVWDNTPGVTKWCLLNCRDKNNCDRKRCACKCVEEKLFRIKFEKLPIKSP